MIKAVNETKHWQNLIIDDEFNVTGKGLVLVVDLVRSELCENLWELDLPEINSGDTISYVDEVYEITSVEIQRNLLNGKKMSRIGLVVRSLF